MEDRKLEAFVDKVMSNDTLEKPPMSFTNEVLGKLDIKSKSITYEPLISKWVWIILGISLSLIVAYALFNHEGSDTSSRLSEFLSFSKIEFKPLQDIDFNVSKTLIYSVVAFSIMIGLQVPLLKSYFNRRLQF
ncbi:hypothetical protein BTO05_12705 [Winogradskyella sp. PC-19]|jgi:hypothetical protein|uniref:hypothetical protein n=1 Tax=unclassified Winogradskyella TaxID=2615021 RepID=UPI000B3CBD5C|nr:MULTISPECIES: hypothetical protein [unclassified Winogradskyella]ARV10451.1 hypothetical protein BTO05_12705 [Winogradskyella sp. PC-19]